MIYISHPYTGNEEKNIADADKIAVMLAVKYPEILFINPIAVMKHEGLANHTYRNIMVHCIELLSKCEAIIMTSGWEKSKGCMAEYKYARKEKITVFESIEAFNKKSEEIASKYGMKAKKISFAGFVR